VKVCFTASSGGHFEQLLLLKDLMLKYDSFIITEKTDYESNSNKNNIRTYYLPQINRKEKFVVIKLLRMAFMSLKIFLKEKPDIIVSLGALSTLQICLISKLFRKKVVFIESFAKMSAPSRTGKFVYKFSDLFIIQWEELNKYYSKAEYGGGIY
jgi:UDP-N-acetylglucosamine:LPS N-acetylglucosamine transferase